MDDGAKGKGMEPTGVPSHGMCRWTTWVICIIVLSPILFLGAIQLVLYQMEEARIGPKHTFVLQGAPRFLTEDLALKYARETLRLEQYPEPDVWTEYDDTNAPDGKKDHYLHRSPNPNIGSMQANFEGRGSRTINMELKDSRIVTYIHRNP